MGQYERSKRYKEKHRELINQRQREYRKITIEARARYRKVKYDKQRAAIEQFKAGKKCGRCGYDDIRALVFHHVNPGEKKFGIAAKIGKISLTRIMAEIAKCELICGNCHLIEHYRSS